ncbi:MAG: hypothetical protein A2504_03395 [Bdellovibrionales bacterium RIFOXYD12_FULL_39_22]|nr:MAG: hypothetical protein A2385_15805 [Bdellovibrionales bacterium RIFOXYB1_FULL_39_21]OFZ41569.1 MAG: hypothetical protein A2485_02495 [Bdellovibrionales bacterium RIFOXYC12_FULL_39_17]OFZ45882.1 MAG: hypothetical protein A2404_12860 [Bdellovibrionales bacterium RIFOXYC1_FULL_39_130]OFZ68682.1 MAG: hypothetical protein A2451_13970 [Bdellovibrionales bacterium RIFOXYC2_FULL_39_8]OFZ74814.1 MAG: hypothetical protein A2560_10290 [Bdellovibrionales bacterium RIFOXYD1_FULL_39_84]OFZ92674.1 MAG:
MQTSCSSYQQFKYITEEFEIPSQVFNVPYVKGWQAALEVMKAYELESPDQEAGIIKTRWTDNTLELNFVDSFGGRDAVKSAQFKIIVNVAKGYKGTGEVSKITIFKKQLVEQDFLQGHKEIPSDGIFEQTLLYRIQRVITIDQKIQEIEKQKSLEAESSF